MKKIYVQPLLEIEDLQSDTILAASDFSINTDTNDFKPSDFSAKDDVSFSPDIED